MTLATDDKHPIPDWQKLVGYQELSSKLLRLHQKEQLPPVLLLTGTQGTGKKTALVQIAATLLCKSKTACGECAECVTLLQGTHSDFMMVDTEASQLKLDEVKQMQDFVSFPPEDSLRILCISDCERITEQGMNRLLKTLEEPYPGTLFLLSSSRPKRLLTTFRSRCLQWPVSRLSSDQVVEIVQTRSPEPVPTSEAIREAIQKFGHSPGILLQRFAEKSGNTDGQDLSRLAQAILNAGSVEDLIKLQYQIPKGAKGKAHALLEELEYALNLDYRRSWQQSSSLNQQPDRVRKRRKTLRELRQALSRNEQLPVNLNLLCENLVINQIQTDC